jgi:hypothetical protein
MQDRAAAPARPLPAPHLPPGDPPVSQEVPPAPALCRCGSSSALGLQGLPEGGASGALPLSGACCRAGEGRRGAELTSSPPSAVDETPEPLHGSAAGQAVSAGAPKQKK